MNTTDKQKEQERLRLLACLTADPRDDAPVGVLLSDEIDHYHRTFKMIDPFVEERLKPAGYELTVGDEYVLGGEKKSLSADGEIRIPSFNVVVIKTAETINLPRFLIARWNIRVKWAYEGLLWVGGPQVDPGWVGHLFCPLYNLSDKVVVIRAGDPIAMIDFVTTTPFKSGKSKEYARPPKRVLLEEYKAAELKSALFTFTEAKTRIDEIERGTRERIDKIENKMDVFFASGLVITTVLFAVIGIFTTFGKETVVPVWPGVSVVISICALALAGFAYLRSRSRK
jgi:deoxycytidine triphosphate deaminase